MQLSDLSRLDWFRLKVEIENHTLNQNNEKLILRDRCTYDGDAARDRAALKEAAECAATTRSSLI
jgi:hypothetical protein